LSQTLLDETSDDREWQLFSDYCHQFEDYEKWEWDMQRRSNFNRCTNKVYAVGEVVEIPVANTVGVVARLSGAWYLELLVEGYDGPQSLNAGHVRKLEERGRHGKDSD
jgi:hypothetical protein